MPCERCRVVVVVVEVGWFGLFWFFLRLSKSLYSQGRSWTPNSCLPNVWTTDMSHYALLWIGLSFFSSFKQYILTTVSPLSIPLNYAPLLSPYINSSSVSHQKRAGLLGTSMEPDITSYNKARHKSSYQGRERQPSREKRVPRVSNQVKDTPLLELELWAVMRYPMYAGNQTWVLYWITKCSQPLSCQSVY